VRDRIRFPAALILQAKSLAVLLTLRRRTPDANGLLVGDLETREEHLHELLRRAGDDDPSAVAALRALAANHANLAGSPAGMLIDPCCGTGTVLAEALTVGWLAHAFDIAVDAVAAAHLNVPDAIVVRGDARRLPLADGTAGAWVSNVLFGRIHRLPDDPSCGSPQSWGTQIGHFASRTSPLTADRPKVVG
jgi:Methyltransferase domain